MSIKQTILGHLTAPHTLVDFHFWATVFWVVFTPPAMIWLADLVPFVTAISLYAIIVSHMAALSASRAEESVKDEGDSTFLS